MPGTIYLIRNGDLYKIGVTNDVDRRMKQLLPDEIVATQVTAYYIDYEKELHQKYSHCRIPQTEYFRLAPHEVDEVCYRLTGDSNQNSVDEAESSIATEPVDIVEYEGLLLHPVTKEDGIWDATFIFNKLKDLAQLEVRVAQLKERGANKCVALLESEIEELTLGKKVFEKYLFDTWGKLDEDGSEGAYYEITVGMLEAMYSLYDAVYANNESDDSFHIDFFDYRYIGDLRAAYNARSKHL